MKIHVQPAAYDDVATMRELYRHEANCQIRYDSALRRKLAEPYIIQCNGVMAGYTGIYPDGDQRSLIEFYILPHLRASALPIFREVLTHTRATRIEAQTNTPLLLLTLYDCATNITRDVILFHDALTTHLTCPNGLLRRATPEDAPLIFAHQFEPVGDWLIEANSQIVATGGFYTHYNPPYADIFMEVAESARQRGYGSYLVQELKRLCYEAGKKPAARTHWTNVASRRTLQKAGLLPCAYLLAGQVDQGD